MMKLLKKLRNDERGAIMIMVAVSMVMIFAFAVMTIDISLIELAKTQLQNAADAAAIAGAMKYAFTGGDLTQATNEAIAVAGLNQAVQTTQQAVNITAADVTFPNANQIRVQTHRTQLTGDPVQLYFLRVINETSTNLGNMTAHAVASITGSSTAKCIEPWIFPDRWTELSVPPNDTFNAGVDIYDGIGYRYPEDIGAQINLFFDNGGTPSIRTGWYQALDFGNGGSCYREAISGCICDSQCCNDITFAPGDTLIASAKPGAMVGPTRQGLGDLIALDPNAYYDAASKTIMGSAYPLGTSPRLAVVATYDPTIGFLSGKQIIIRKFVVIFIEGFDNKGNVVGRFMQKYEPDGDPGGLPGFLYTVHLIE